MVLIGLMIVSSSPQGTVIVILKIAIIWLKTSNYINFSFGVSQRYIVLDGKSG